MLRLLKYGGLIAATTLLVGCTSTNPSQPNSHSPAVSNSYHSAHVIFRDQCIQAKDDEKPQEPAGVPETKKTPQELAGIASLAASLLPSMVDKGIEFVADYLKKRQAELTATTTAKGYMAWVPRDDKHVLGCLIFTKGDFSGDANPTAETGENAVWTRDKLMDLAFAKAPAFYLESWVHYADAAKTHIALTPAFFDYRATAAKRTGSDNKKDILVTFNFSPALKSKAGSGHPMVPPPKVPGTKVGQEASGVVGAANGDVRKGLSFAIAFQGTRIGTQLNSVALRGLRTEAGALSGDESLGLSNVQMTVLETEEGGDLLLAISTFVVENKETISPAIQAMLKELLDIKKDAGS